MSTYPKQVESKEGEAVSAFALTEKETENIVMAVVRGAGRVDGETAERLSLNFVESIELARIAIVINDLVQDGLVDIMEDENDPDGWKVKSVK